jgi:hypothetical protein
MDYQIYETVTVSDEDEDDVTSGSVYYHGKQVCLIAQSETDCVFGIENRNGDIVWIDYWINQPRERVRETATKYGARGIDDSYVGGMAFEIPYNRTPFLRALQRIPNHEK